jgi:DNA ligase 4
LILELQQELLSCIHSNSEARAIAPITYFAAPPRWPMGFKFSSLVELLEDLERNRFRKISNASRSINPDKQIIIAWFNRHDTKIKRSQHEGVAFLSCLFPERRPDRCFHMQETRLASIIGRVYHLGTGRLNELRAWKERKPADFASCLASVLAQTEMPVPRSGNEVTLEEISLALDEIAANIKGSAPALRAKASPFDAVEILTPILCRLQSTEVKWLVRMLLKSFRPVQIPENITMQQFHFMLPDLLTIQNDFSAAVNTLSHAELAQLPNRVSEADATNLKTRLAGHLAPKLGVMIKRQEYIKARSIKHCCQMADGKAMSVEEKYDGEYCQIHIDMSKDPSKRIQIFSKSGRDSTQERINLHFAIEISLNLRFRLQACKIKEACILEGELLIWNRSTELIQPFHKIRQHVDHGGRFLDNEADSPVGFDEQVMIMYYDILLLDQLNCLERPQEERRRTLQHLITTSKGLAGIGVQHDVDFRSKKAPEQLRDLFATCITQRLEGFVLKFCKDPYYSCTSEVNGIKLKKDYIAQLGDIADLCLVGARLDLKAQRKLGHCDAKWNSFYMACLDNKADVQRFHAKPAFKVIGEVSFMPQHDMEYLNRRGQISAMPFSAESEFLSVEMDLKQMKPPEVLFKKPFVVEILGSGYERPPNATYWTLRHPRLHKLHTDRGIAETVSFDELKNMCKTAQTAPLDAASQEDLEWIRKLESADSKSKQIVDKSQNTGTTPSRCPESITTASLTPVRSVQKDLPFAIWSEASQSPEVANETFSQEGTSPAPARSTKRAFASDHEEAAVISKKRRTSSTKTPRTARPVLNPSPLTRNTSFTLIHAALAANNSYLKKTPPWCRPTSRDGSGASSPFEPPAIFKSSPSKRKSRRREPLVVVTNDSRTPEAATSEGTPDDQSKTIGETSPARMEVDPNASLSNTKEAIACRSKVNHISAPARPWSSEDSMSNGKVAPTKQLAEEARTGAETVAAHDTAPAAVLSPSYALLPPILLTSSLRTLNADSSAALLGLIHTASMSFTYSAVHFISHIVHQQPAAKLMMALIDLAASPEIIASEIGDAMDRLLGLEIGCDNHERENGKLLFLDWTFLATLERSRDLDEALRNSKQYAAGCLTWRLADVLVGGNDTRTICEVRECFDWEETINM